MQKLVYTRGPSYKVYCSNYLIIFGNMIFFLKTKRTSKSIEWGVKWCPDRLKDNNLKDRLFELEFNHLYLHTIKYVQILMTTH